MWAPLPPEPPAPGWWTELPTELDWWVEGIAAELRGRRLERLRAKANEVEVRAATALERDQRIRRQLAACTDPDWAAFVRGGR